MATIQGMKRFLQIDTVAETTPGFVNDSPTWRYPEMVSGGFGLKEEPVYDDISIEANLTAQPAETRSGFAPAGSLEMVAAPYDPTAGQLWSVIRHLLNMATKKTAGVLPSHTMTCFYPTGVSPSCFGRRFTGCKANTLGLSWGVDNRLKNPELGIMGMFPSSVPGSAILAATPAFPAQRHWNFTYMGIQAAGTALADYKGAYTMIKTLRNLNATLNNNLTPGQTTYAYDAAGALITGPSSIDEGQQEVTGDFELKLENETAWLDPFRDGTLAQLRLLGFHPSSAVCLATASAGFSTKNSALSGGASTVNVAVDDASDFAVGDVCYLEDSSAADPANWVREVLMVNTKPDESHLTFDLDGQTANYEESIGRDQTFTQGTRIYRRGIQLFIRAMTLKDWEDQGGAIDTLYQRLSFKAGVYTGTHPNLGAGYQFPLMGWLVH